MEVDTNGEFIDSHDNELEREPTPPPAQVKRRGPGRPPGSGQSKATAKKRGGPGKKTQAPDEGDHDGPGDAEDEPPAKKAGTVSVS